jgi:hypothetical protein
LQTWKKWCKQRSASAQCIIEQHST